jgi:hypothetical protein
MAAANSFGASLSLFIGAFSPCGLDQPNVNESVSTPTSKNSSWAWTLFQRPINGF